MSRLEPMLDVKFSGWRGCNRDDLFGFERLKVDDNNSHGCDSIQHFLVSKCCCVYLAVHHLFLMTAMGRKHGSWHSIFADEEMKLRKFK